MADTYDVAVIGAGPAGLMLTTCLARLGVRALILDENSGVHEWGKGDALMPRTIEVLHQLGDSHPGTSVGELITSRGTMISGLAGYVS